MADNVIQLPRTPIRAYVIIPDDDPMRDFCRVVRGGYPIDDDGREIQGPLCLVLERLRDQYIVQGVPVTIHPECKRRAAA